MSPRITHEVAATVKHWIELGKQTSEIKEFIRNKTALGKTQVNDAFNEISKMPKAAVQDFFNFEESGDTATLNAKMATPIVGFKTLDELLEHCGINSKDWSIKTFTPNTWGGQTKDGPVIFSQVKAILERKIPRNTKASMDEFKADLINYSPRVPKIERNRPEDGGLLLEVCAFDLHLGKAGEADEVGTKYNIDVACEIFLAALQDILAKAQKQGPISRIVFPVGNDFLNIDNNHRTTTAGTPQDCDGSFSKIFRRGRELLVQAINLLKQAAPVDVVVVRGNHDNASMFHLGDALYCWFHNDENVTVDNDAKSRKYYTFHENLILYTHGDKEKQDKLPLIAATEEPAIWSASKWREIRVGHLHHEIVKEYNGVKIRWVPSLSGNDLYHYDRGYTGNVRVAQGFLFDPNYGLESILYSKPIV